MEVFVHASDKVLSNPTLFVKWLDKAHGNDRGPAGFPALVVRAFCIWWRQPESYRAGIGPFDHFFAADATD